MNQETVRRCAGPLAVLLMTLCVAACGDTLGDESVRPTGYAGRVLDIAGQPIAGATVGVILGNTQGLARSLGPTPGTPTVLTQASGSWHVPHQPRIWFITISAPGYCRVYLSTVSASALYDAVLLPTEGRMRGRVLDSSGHPLPGAHIEVSLRSGHSEWSTQSSTRSDGHFEMPLPRGASDWAHVRVRHAEHWSGTAGVPALNAKGETTIEVHLHPNPPIRGRVIDAATGNPIRNAGVRNAGEVKTRVRTDDRGHFVLRRRHTHHWQVRADAPGYEPGAADPVPGVDGSLTALVRLSATSAPTPAHQEAASASVEGIIVDAKGRPLPRAHVMARATGGFGPRSQGEQATVASAQGQFLLEGLAPGLHVLWAHRHGQCVLGETYVELQAKARTSDVRVEVPAGHTLKGRVMEGRSAPITGALVVARRPGRPGSSTARTGPDGRFELRGLPEAVVRLGVYRFGLRGDVHSLVFGGAGELASPISVVRQAFPFRQRPDRPGRLLRLVGSVPPDGTRLQARNKYAAPGRSLDLIVRGDTVRVGPEATATWTLSAPGFYAGPIELSPEEGSGSPEIPRVEVGRGTEIHGRVLTSDGTPIAGATITLPHDVVWALSPRHRTVQSNAAGEFRVPGIQPGDPLSLSFYARGFLTSSVATQRDVDNLDIVLASAVRVSGRIVPAAGESLSTWYRLDIVHEDGTARGWLQSGMPAGHFRCDHLKPGVWFAAVRTWCGAEGPRTRFEVHAGSAPTDLEVRSPPRGIVLSGKVLDSTGRGIPNVRVFVNKSGFGQAKRRHIDTSHEGSFELRTLAARPYDLEFVTNSDSPFSGAVRRGLKAGSEGLIIRLSRRGRILGRIETPSERWSGGRPGFYLLPADAPLPSWGALRRRPARELHQGYRLYDRILFEGVDPGRYRIVVVVTDPMRGYGVGLGVSSTPLVVRPGQTLRGVRVPIERGASLHVSVLGADASKAITGQVRITHSTWGAVVRDVTARLPGSAYFQFLPSGTWRVELRPDTQAPWGHAQDSVLSPGESVKLELRLPPP